MNELQVFKNEEFGTVRTVLQNGEPWFIGKDVADILGYCNLNEAIQDHVDEEDKLNSKTLSSFNIDLGQRGGILINESGLYSLILSSKMPDAKKFKRWVTSEVLPSVRKNGGYIANQEHMTQEQIVANALIVANNIINDQKKQLAEQQPKVEVYEQISDSSTLQDIQTVAKTLKLKNIFKVLQNDFIIKKTYTEDGVDYYKYYAKYEDYFVLKDKPFTKGNGDTCVRPRLFVTGKGVLWLTKKYGAK